MGPPPAPAPGQPPRPDEKRCREEPLLPTDRGTPPSRAAEQPVLPGLLSPDAAGLCFSSKRCKSWCSGTGWFPRGSSPVAGLAAQEDRQQSPHRGSSTVFYSECRQVDTDYYLLLICFLNIINSDYSSQISLQNFRVIGFYNAVKKDINWLEDLLDNHSHHSFINIAIIWHFWMEEDCKAPADPVKHVKWRLVLLLSLSLVKDN